MAPRPLTDGAKFVLRLMRDQVIVSAVDLSGLITRTPQ